MTPTQVDDLLVALSALDLAIVAAAAACARALDVLEAQRPDPLVMRGGAR